jgi:sugar lactone lactonase YvrE
MKNDTILLVDDLVFPESPRWRDGRLWFSDMLAGRVITVDLKGRIETVLKAPGWISGLGWLPDGRLLVVSMNDRRLLRLDPGGLVEAANLESLTTFICNDMVVDEAGRAYVGEVGFDVHGGAPFKPAALVLVQADGQALVVDADLACPNGAVITPDGRSLIVAESVGDRLTAFEIEPDGSLTGKRVWAAIEGLGPDGICLDAEGAIWVASPMRGEVVRVLEGGQVTNRIAVTPLMPLAVMLGGFDRRTLFICRAPHPDVAMSARQGRIEMLQVDVPGAGLP